MELFAEFNDGLRIYYYDNRRFRVFKRGNNIFISDIDNSFQYCKNGNGNITIPFHSKEDYNRIIKLLKK